MTSHTTYRRHREGFLADPMTMYSINNIFNESFSLSGVHKLILGEYNIDLDHIYDRCEEERLPFEKIIKDLSLILFNTSDPFKKNLIFYKYLHDFCLELRDLTEAVYNSLISMVNIDDLIESDNPQNQNIIKDRLLAILNNYNIQATSDPDYYNTEEFICLRKIDDFLYNHFETLRMFSGKITETFNNVIKNAYRKRFEEGNRRVNSFLNSEAMTMISTPTSSTNSLWYSRYNMSSAVDLNITTTTSTHTTSLIDPYSSLFESGTNSRINRSDAMVDLHNYYATKKPVLKEKPKINKKTPGVKVLNKSMKILQKFMSNFEFHSIINCKEVLIKGRLFHYGFRIRNRMDLITNSANTDNFAISWDLNIYTKEDNKLARACIVFPKSPILDQVLSVYLMIKADKENDILLNSGFFDKDNIGFYSILEPYVTLLKKDKTNETNKKEKNILDNALERLRENSNNWTLDGSNTYENSRRLRALNRYSNIAELKISVKNWLRDFFISKGLSSIIYNYTMENDVSFSEAIDYEAFNLFDNKLFDNYVQPLVWKKDYFRFQNKISLEVEPKKYLLKSILRDSKVSGGVTSSLLLN